MRERTHLGEHITCTHTGNCIVWVRAHSWAIFDVLFCALSDRNIDWEIHHCLPVCTPMTSRARKACTVLCFFFVGCVDIVYCVCVCESFLRNRNHNPPPRCHAHECFVILCSHCSCEKSVEALNALVVIGLIRLCAAMYLIGKLWFASDGFEWIRVFNMKHARQKRSRSFSNHFEYSQQTRRSVPYSRTALWLSGYREQRSYSGKTLAHLQAWNFSIRIRMRKRSSKHVRVRIFVGPSIAISVLATHSDAVSKTVSVALFPLVAHSDGDTHAKNTTQQTHTTYAQT